MRIAALFAALLFLASPIAGRAAAPTASCPDMLVGDSLAVGMAPYARAAGFEVMARTGIGLAWLRAQGPRCARRLVVVIGTNDLRGIDPWSAEAYPGRLAAILSRWQAEQITWATPGCFPRDESLERGSEALSRVLARGPLVRVGAGRGYMRVHSGRPARCSYLSGDGIHPSGAGYRAWWANLSQAIGPAPEEERHPTTRALREARARPPVLAVRQVQAGSAARSARHARPTQLTRPDRRAPQALRAERRNGRVQVARPSPSARQLQPPRARQSTALAPRQSTPPRSTQPARAARPTPQRAQAQQLRAPRFLAASPIRRT